MANLFYAAYNLLFLFFSFTDDLGCIGIVDLTCRMVVALVWTRLDEVVHIHPMVQSTNGIDRPLFEQSVFFSRRGCLIFRCTVCIGPDIEEPIEGTYVVALLGQTTLVRTLVNGTITGKEEEGRNLVSVDSTEQSIYRQFG